MKWHKRLLKHPAFLSLMAWIASLYIRFTYLTIRWKVEGEEHLNALEQSERPYIIVFWHGRLLMPALFTKRERPIDVIISSHGDGLLISKTITHFQLNTIKGSTTHGAMTALKNAFRSLKSGHIVAITPDGPRGPRMRVTGKVIDIAKKFDVPIIPMTFATKRHKIIRSWDRFFLALPFCRGIFTYGEPLYINDMPQEKAGKELEKRLNTINEHVDRFIGIEPIKPELQ